MFALPLLAPLLVAAARPAAATPVNADLVERAANSSLVSCQQIASGISSASAVAYPPLPNYITSFANYGLTNTAFPTCIVYPATTDDVAVALKAVAANKAPFGVRGAGHCMNKGCSSTNGVLISMKRYDKTVYDSSAGTVQIGSGLIWDDVYSNLTGTGVSVVGGRVSGVGVAGFALGGGYSYYTNQYGLTSDTIVQYELVLPTGTAINVTDRQETSDLFFGLKGGFNNFGIVTRFWLTAVPAPPMVWGGAQFYSALQYDKVAAACANFDAKNTDPKASLLCTSLVVGSIPNWLLIAFYDAPQPPEPGPFTELRSIPTIAPLWKSQTQAEFTKGIPADLAGGQRIWYHSASVKQLTPNMFKAIKAIGNKYAAGFIANSGVIFNLNPEPFVKGFFKNAKNSAYPHSEDNELKPIEINLAWVSPLADNYMKQLSFNIEKDLLAAARADGQDLPDSTNYLYPNYALTGTSLAHMYGSNVAQLNAIAKKYDPQGVMTQAGGFKFQ